MLESVLLFCKSYRFSWDLILPATLSIKGINDIALRIDDFSKTNLTSSEANTKKRIIEPLLELLNWDTRSNEVLLEYPIRIGSTTKYVDYALVLEDKPVVFVEAKPFDVTLSEDDSSQIISYGRVEDVQWVVLTNGRALKVFDTKIGKTEKECLVTEVDLKKLPMQAENLNLISRESVLTGEIEAAAKRLAATKSAIQNLKERQKEVVEEFTKIILKITGTEVKNRVENISKQLADEAVKLFEQQVETAPKQILEKEIQTITRQNLVDRQAGEVVVCPSKVEGVAFLKKYNAWGFVAMSKRHVPYFALYVGKPESSILYFGEVESITQPLTSKENLVKIQEKDKETFESGKRVIHLKPGTLVKLVDPIPLKNRKQALRGLRYTTLKKLVQANDVGEL